MFLKFQTSLNKKFLNEKNLYFTIFLFLIIKLVKQI